MPQRRDRGGFVSSVAAIALLASVMASPDVLAQQSFATGQTISPAYEGWTENADGSFDLVFGYMNRNWEETPTVLIGPDNNIEPGGP